MKQSALHRLETEFGKWVKAYNSAKKESANSESLFNLLCDRIPPDYLRHIGAALLNGWLETEKKPSRGYFVRESDRQGIGGGQCTITNYGGGLIAPCWELFVQLSDYGWMRSIAEKKGHRVLLEDRLMDITVSSNDKLILYIENKEKAAAAKKLIKGMREYGETGFDLDQPDRGDDALRKSKYIVKKDTRPKYLGMSAIGFRQLFEVKYYSGNRFKLTQDNRAFSAPLAEYSDSLTKPSSVRSPVDPLACEIEQLCPEIWLGLARCSCFLKHPLCLHGYALLCF